MKKEYISVFGLKDMDLQKMNLKDECIAGKVLNAFMIYSGLSNLYRSVIAIDGYECAYIHTMPREDNSIPGKIKMALIYQKETNTKELYTKSNLFEIAGESISKELIMQVRKALTGR